MENLPANEINLSANEVKLHTEIYGLKREVIHLRSENEALREVVKAIAHIGIDYGYGAFELNRALYITKARALIESQAAKGE